MPPSPDVTRPGSPQDEAPAAERLLNSLIGVTAARVVAAPEGGIEAVHLLTTSDQSPRELVASVLTALRAHLDLAIDPDRVSVARVREGVPLPSAPTPSPLPPRRRSGESAEAPPRPARPPRPAAGEEAAMAPPAADGATRDPRPGPAGGLEAPGEAARATRAPGSAAPEGAGGAFPPPYREPVDESRLLDLFPPPWPERAEGLKGADPSRPSGDGTTGAPGARPAGVGGGRETGRGREGSRNRATGGTTRSGNEGGDRLAETRLVFLGHEATRRRAEGEVRIRVELDWLGERFHGDATAPDEAGLRLTAPAEATLRAIEAAVAARPQHDVRIALRLNGVELVEAFGLRHVMVSVHAEVDGRAIPLTGTLVADESPELSTILATLQATDRSARAVLQNHMAWGPPRVGRDGPRD